MASTSKTSKGKLLVMCNGFEMRKGYANLAKTIQNSNLWCPISRMNNSYFCRRTFPFNRWFIEHANQLGHPVLTSQWNKSHGLTASRTPSRGIDFYYMIQELRSRISLHDEDVRYRLQVRAFRLGFNAIDLYTEDQRKKVEEALKQNGIVDMRDIVMTDKFIYDALYARVGRVDAYFKCCKVCGYKLLEFRGTLRCRCPKNYGPGFQPIRRNSDICDYCGKACAGWHFRE